MALTSKMPAKKAAIKTTVIMISGRVAAVRVGEARKCTVSMEIISRNYALKRRLALGQMLDFQRQHDIACPVPAYGLWLSLVERCVRDAEAVGSNPTSPTNSSGLRGTGIAKSSEKAQEAQK